VVRALVLTEPRRLEARELPIPDVTADDGILSVEACGLCGTDHEQFTGTLRAGFAFVPGHEIVGTIEAVGDAAARRWGVTVGDRVAVEVFQSCGECPTCRSGEYRRCHRHGLRDMYGFVDVERAPGLWGGYAEQVYLAPDVQLVPVPAGLDPVAATLFNPLGAGIRWAVTLPETPPAATVAVLGPGIRGLSALVALRAHGAGLVMVTGAGPADEPRLALARALGADLTVDVASEDPVAALRSASGGVLADVVVDVTARAPAALGQAVALARPGGTVVLAGTRGTDDTPGFVPDHVVFKELRLLGALGVDVDAYRAAFALLADPTFPLHRVAHVTAGLDDAADLVAAMAGEPGTGRAGERPVHGVIVPDAPDQRGRGSS
jgi:alcohol dehydrogenase